MSLPERSSTGRRLWSGGGHNGTDKRPATSGSSGQGSLSGGAGDVGPERVAWLLVGLGGVTLVDLLVSEWAQHALPGRSVPFGPLDLQLGYNTGVAFGLGRSAPAWLVLLMTGTVTAGLLVLGWRAARRSTWSAAALGLAGGGALGNLLDRARDGVVTDYLHTGWWPTFNLADVAIVTGAALLLLRELTGADRSSGPEPAASA